MLSIWRLLLGRGNAGDRWLATGVYLSEQATQRIARNEAQK
jgi:hypothetical protein